MLAAQSIQLGVNDIVVAGGMECMSNVPKYLAEARLTFHTLLWLIILLSSFINSNHDSPSYCLFFIYLIGKHN